MLAQQMHRSKQSMTNNGKWEQLEASRHRHLRAGKADKRAFWTSRLSPPGNHGGRERVSWVQIAGTLRPPSTVPLSCGEDASWDLTPRSFFHIIQQGGQHLLYGSRPTIPRKELAEWL